MYKDSYRSQLNYIKSIQNLYKKYIASDIPLKHIDSLCLSLNIHSTLRYNILHNLPWNIKLDEWDKVYGLYTGLQQLVTAYG